MRRTQAEMKAGQVMFEPEVRQQLERMTEMLNRLLQGELLSKKPLLPTASSNNQDIIVLGGYSSRDFRLPLKTVEKFNMVEGKSTQYPDMQVARGTPGSCVYQGEVIVLGGYDGNQGTDVIEVLKTDQHHVLWVMFTTRLLVKLLGHVAIVYQGSLYLIGGQNWSLGAMSDRIFKMNLNFQHSLPGVLASMPQPRRNHRAELVNGKLFILGGMSTNTRVLDSVIVYDFIKNEFQPCPSLLQPVKGMSTVTWGNMIIIVGGEDKNGQVLNDVIMYDTEIKQSERLPSMTYKRKGCSAVVMNDVIVVLGGRSKEQGYLNSVESVTIGGDGWKEPPGMMVQLL